MFARLPDPDGHHHLHDLGPEAEQEVRHQEVPPPSAGHEVTLPPHLPLHHESHSTFRYISTITFKLNQRYIFDTATEIIRHSQIQAMIIYYEIDC